MTEIGRSPEPLGFEDGAKRREEIHVRTHDRLADAKRDFEAVQDQQRQAQTVGQWIRESQTRMANPANAQSLERAKEATGQLPQSVQSQWTGNLRLLEQLATKRINNTVGDPIAVLRLIASLESEQLPQLMKLAATGGDESFRQAVAAIQAAFSAFKDSIGPGHAAVVPNIPRAARTGVTAQESNLVRGGIVLVTGTIAVGTGILAFFAKPEDRSVAFPIGYGLVAAFAAGYGGLTPTEQLGRQVTFLVEAGGSWRELQRRYGIQGSDWAEFVTNIYDNRRRNTVFANLFKPGTADQVKERRSALLEMAPAGIHGELTRMFNSGDASNRGVDLRSFLDILQKATSRDAQSVVVNCILSPPSASVRA